jgi:hypothetical protein
LAANSSTHTAQVAEEQAALTSIGATRRVFPRFLAAALFFAGLEGLLFHVVPYASIVEPNSTTGFMETQLSNETRRPKHGHNQVLAVGNSRMALLPRVANEMQPATGYTFATIGLGGTTPRDWFYELRAVDPARHTYSAIVIPSDDFNEPDGYEHRGERESDLHYLIARLGWRDLFDLPWTYETRKLQWVAVRGIVLKGFVYKRDFEELLNHPQERIAEVLDSHRKSAGWHYNFEGTKDSLAGIQIDWQHRRIRFPDGIPAGQREIIYHELFPDPAPQNGQETAYLRYWYGRILNYYRGSGTKLIFMRVPRAPISPPDAPPKPGSAVRQLASRPGVIVLDEHLFDPVERPEFLWDGWHLNGAGMNRFSAILSTEVRKVLGPPQS